MLAFEVASRVSIRIRSTLFFLHSSTKSPRIMRLFSKSRLPDTSVRRNSLMGIILTSIAIVHPGALYSQEPPRYVIEYLLSPQEDSKQPDNVAVRGNGCCLYSVFNRWTATCVANLS